MDVVDKLLPPDPRSIPTETLQVRVDNIAAFNRQATDMAADQSNMTHYRMVSNTPLDGSKLTRESTTLEHLRSPSDTFRLHSIITLGPDGNKAYPGDTFSPDQINLYRILLSQFGINTEQIEVVFDEFDRSRLNVNQYLVSASHEPARTSLQYERIQPRFIAWRNRDGRRFSLGSLNRQVTQALGQKFGIKESYGAMSFTMDPISADNIRDKEGNLNVQPMLEDYVQAYKTALTLLYGPWPGEVSTNINITLIPNLRIIKQ